MLTIVALYSYRLWEVDSGVLGAVGVFIIPEEFKGCNVMESLGSHTSLSKKLEKKLVKLMKRLIYSLERYYY